MTRARQALGKYGEDLACRELERRGYAILARRYRTRHGELDIVAQHDGVVVFVEVKARQGAEYGEGSASVGSFKQRQVTAMAADYVSRHGLADRPCRFDVVTVESALDPPKITVFPDAFRPGWA